MKRSFPLVLLLLSFATIHGFAQSDGRDESHPLPGAGGLERPTKYLIGLGAHGSWNLFTTELSALDLPGWPSLESGSGPGFSAGLVLEYPLTSRQGIRALASFDWRWADFERFVPRGTVPASEDLRRENFDENFEMRPVPGDTGSPAMIQRAELALKGVTLDVFYVAKGQVCRSAYFGAMLGPSLTVIVQGNLRTSAELDSSEQGRFLNSQLLPVEQNGRRIILRDADLPGLRRLQPALVGGIFFDFRVLSNGMITPGLFARWGLTSLSESRGLRMFSIELAVNARLAW